MRKPSAMGRSRDIGLTGSNGKGSVPRTNTASKTYQRNYDRIFRRKPFDGFSEKMDKH